MRYIREILFVVFACLVSPQAFSSMEVDYSLILGGVRFDPLTDQPALPGPWSKAPSDKAEFHLVQFFGPIQAYQVKAMENDHVHVVRYLHPYTYIVWAQHERLTQYAAAESGSVRWAGVFQPGYKVTPEVFNLKGPSFKMSLLVYRGTAVTHLLKQVANLGGTKIQRAAVDRFFEHVVLNLPDSSLAQVAALPGVYALQPRPTDGGRRAEMAAQLNAGNLTGGTINPGYQAWLSGLGLDGSGVTVASVDEGIEDTHSDLANRLAPCSGETCGGGLSDDHGTHVAGILGGDGSSGVVDGDGFLRGLGIAPGVSMVEQFYLDQLLEPDGLIQLMADSYNNGAVLSSNSWGTSQIPSGYTADSMVVDGGVRDADPDVPGNQQLSYIIAIENGGGGTSSQGVPEEAKNLIKVGATRLQEMGGGQSPLFNNISATSAHGPALDGRNLPDIVAPGGWVDSCQLGNSHGLRSGTSMAAPSVAGGAALFVELYRDLPSNPGSLNPSPAMVKAALLPVSHDLEGNMDADGVLMGHRFDSKQGWGRLNLEDLLDSAVDVAYYDQPVVFQNTNDTWIQPLFVADNSQPVKIMLVWTDAPGHGLGGAAPAWSNNLDLEVEYNSQTYLGNNIGGDGWSATGGTADEMNNTEGVLIGPTAPQTNLTVTVTATNLPADAVNTGGPSQDFALVCYNCTASPDYIVLAPEPSQSACKPNDAEFDINLGQIGGFGDPVTLSVANLPAGLTATFGTNPITPPATTTLTISDTNMVADGDYNFQVVGTAGATTHQDELSLRLDGDVPMNQTLVSPTNGSIGQSQSPEFRWNAITGVSSYSMQIATDPDFINVVHAEITLVPEFDYTSELVYDTLYYWRVRPTNVCGMGDSSPVWSFTTVAAPPVLLVDDDDNDPDVRAFYTAALDFWGVGYDIWDTLLSSNEPNAVELAPYSTVIWFSGDAFDINLELAGPTAASENVLSTYMDNGGNLILTSMHYLFQRAGNPPVLNSFMTDYLGIGSVSLNGGQNIVIGSGVGFNHLGPYNVEPNTYNANRCDVVSPMAPAQLLFSGDMGDAGVQLETLDFKSFFMAFPFDSLTVTTRGESEAQLETMLALLTACGVSVDVCRTQENLRSKLPFWPDDQTLASLIDCVNTIFAAP